MPKIHILDDATVSKIAAGEVIERPASIVKELLENSIDAGATRISVDAKDSGRTFIIVTDNGCGMSRTDALLSIQKHATSKIAQIEDLERIGTLGFRGEALSSICAAADVDLVTKMKGELAGSSISVVHNAVKEVKETGCPDGTAVAIRNIFANTPARLKHLKPEKVELAHIIDVVSRYALAYPGIAFNLRHNGVMVFNSTGRGKLLDTIISVYDNELAKQLFEIYSETDICSIYGFLGMPSVNRSSADWQSIFVNKRWVKSPLVSGGLRQAYGTMLPKDRFPFAILFIVLPPKYVDVNVHPAKTEVKFVNDMKVYESILKTCRDALFTHSRKMYPEVKASTMQEKIVTDLKIETVVSTIEIAPTTGSQEKAKGLQKHLPVQHGRIDTTHPIASGVPRVLGLAHDTYAILETDDGIMLMDQHAAHERILFEEFEAIMTKGISEKQELISPVNLELTAKECTIIEHYGNILGTMGFSIERFGGNTVTVRAVPVAVAGSDEKLFIHDVIDDLIREARGKDDGNITSEQLLKIVARRAATTACRKALKAGDIVAIEYLQTIVKQLFGTKNPYSCPHGRPIIITLTKKELERKFGRV